MNEIIRNEIVDTSHGVPGRFSNVVADDKTGRIMGQKFTATRFFNNSKGKIVVTMRFDDECKNGHESFSIIGETYRKRTRDNWVEESSGCIHDEIAKHFPELAHLIKWHLCSTDGPMHYVANTVYEANDRDCWGLKAGERRQIVNGRTGEPFWHLVAIDKDGTEIELHTLPKSKDGERPTETWSLEYRPWCQVGEGKERNLKHARSSAVWPDATDEDLTAPGLKDRLLARLPALLNEFKRDMLQIGFLWTENKQ